VAKVRSGQSYAAAAKATDQSDTQKEKTSEPKNAGSSDESPDKNAQTTEPLQEVAQQRGRKDKLSSAEKKLEAFMKIMAQFMDILSACTNNQHLRTLAGAAKALLTHESSDNSDSSKDDQSSDSDDVEEEEITPAPFTTGIQKTPEKKKKNKKKKRTKERKKTTPLQLAPPVYKPASQKTPHDDQIYSILF
jgi:hypothetical protein